MSMLKFKLIELPRTSPIDIKKDFETMISLHLKELILIVEALFWGFLS